MISWNVLQSRNCMATASTDRNIWLSSMSLPTKLRLHLVFIIHVILYRAETWPPARQLQRNIDAFHRSVCGVYYAFSGGPHFYNKEVLRALHLHTSSLSSSANLSVDHNRALRASVVHLPRDRNRRSGRPRHTLLRTVGSDLAPLNIGLATAYR